MQQLASVDEHAYNVTIVHTEDSCLDPMSVQTNKVIGL